jgi:hypothetical protein
LPPAPHRPRGGLFKTGCVVFILAQKRAGFNSGKPAGKVCKFNFAKILQKGKMAAG